jgi:hypothetical protein
VTIPFSLTFEDCVEAYRLLRERGEKTRRAFAIAYAVIFVWTMGLLVYGLRADSQFMRGNLFLGSAGTMFVGGFIVKIWLDPDLKALWNQSPQSSGTQSVTLAAESLTFSNGKRTYRIKVKSIKRVLETPNVFAIKAWDGRLRHFWMIAKSKLNEDEEAALRNILPLLIPTQTAFPVITSDDASKVS